LDVTAAPLRLLVRADDWAPSDPVRQAFADAGWRVEDAPAAPDALPSDATLVLVAHPAGDGWVARLRQGEGAAADAAVAALPATAGSSRLLALGFDDWLDPDTTAGEIAAVADRWKPLAGAPSPSLVATFGAEAVASLLRRLRAQLADVLGARGGAGASAKAHDLAGSAGILSFAELGRAWLAVTEREAGALVRAHRETRRALLAIDRQLAALEERS
jgi:hypothetical protein